MTVPFVPLIAAFLNGLLIVLLVNYQEERDRVGKWLIAFLGTSAALSTVVALLYAAPGNPWLLLIATYVQAATMACLLFLSLAYGKWGGRMRVPIVGVLSWFVLLVISNLLARETVVWSPIVDTLLFFPPPDVYGTFFLLSWAVVAVGLVVGTLYGAARARLPLHANRLLYWAAALTVVLVGQLLFALKEPVLSGVGATVQLLGTGGLLYGVTSYRIIDVRGSTRRVVGYFLLTTVTAVVIIIAVLAARALTEGQVIGGAILTMVGLAFALGGIQQFAHHRAEKFIDRYVIQREYDPAVIVENYAQAIGNILDPETLSAVAIGTISELLETQGGWVMLVTTKNGRVVVEPVGGAGQSPGAAMSFSKDGPVFSHFVERRRPLLQYDIDVLPEFRSLSEEQRHWLLGLNMAVFVPIASEGLPVGLLAVGSKGSGEPYRSDELQLLQTLGGQTVVALTNARLYDDLKTLNAEIRLLNEDLRRSNERLRRMGQVKTDFITIASHELRTPLTQVKGYSEILSSVIEDGVLTPERGRTLTAQIEKAAEQLEDVINAMLDVSQIDAEGVSLRLSETRLDSVVRIAVEPLAEPARERNLALTVQGFEGLPLVLADPQRLVQAVRNLAYNAVKYTPDGGRITISARVLPDERGQDREIELVVADTGVGIDPADQELIFEKFFRTADPILHSSGGTKFMGAGPGLGLPIARGIVKAHGGRIWVESAGHDPERCPGSEFHVVLPIRSAAPAGGQGDATLQP